MSGVGFLATMKTFAPSIRRRRRIEKQNLELHNNHNNNNNNNNNNSSSNHNNNGGQANSGGSTPGSGGGGAGTPGAGMVSSTASTPTDRPSAASGILGGVGEVISPGWDIVPPITPPAAFLPPGYKRLSMKGKKVAHVSVCWVCEHPHPHLL
uniref:Putative serine/threonine-protein kinase n=2 Tax=Anopheles triannulatus TaxID=58253 RepID=A0A2M4AS13_9DIPT